MRYATIAQLQAACEIERRKRTGEILPVWYPHPDNLPQVMAYNSEADEVFYGGAAGGGKSALILGLSITQHIRSIIFRSEYTQMVELRDQLLGYVKDAKVNWQERAVRTTDGRKIEFGAADDPKDWMKFSGRPHDFIGIDELPLFKKSNFTMLKAWLRTTEKGQRARIVATGNPPTDNDGEWVIDEWAPWLDDSFPDPAKPGELRWYVTRGDATEWVSGPGTYDIEGRKVKSRSRTFIPAKVTDNPYFSDGAYYDVLASLPEQIRAKMLDGDFKRVIESNPWQVIPTEWIEAAMNREHNHGYLDAIGVDVARGGKDKTVISCRSGIVFHPLIKIPGTMTPNGESVYRFVSEVHEPSSEIGVDILGVGGSAYDSLVAQGWNVLPLSGGETSTECDSATGKLGFVNKRSEWYWKLRESLDPDTGANICLPRDNELKADLSAPRYTLRGMKIAVEKKDEIKKRLARSPDCGDSVVYAWAVGDNRWFDNSAQAKSITDKRPIFVSGSGTYKSF